MRSRIGGGRVLWGRSLPYEEQTPYRAFGQILRTAAGIYENDGIDVARQKLGTLIGSLFPANEVADTARYLSLLLGLGVGEAASESIHLLFAAPPVVELLSERGPLLLVFEDVHWADDSLLDLVDYLVSHVRDHSVAFLALARPEFLESGPTWGAGMTGHTMLPLEPSDDGRGRRGRRRAARGSRCVDGRAGRRDGRGQPAVPRGAGGGDGRRGRRRGVARNGAGRDRCADRRTVHPMREPRCLPPPWSASRSGAGCSRGSASSTTWTPR